MTKPQITSERSLRAADRIVLVDPNCPIFYRRLYTRFVQGRGGTLQISIDSADPMAVQRWNDRILQLELPE